MDKVTLSTMITPKRTTILMTMINIKNLSKFFNINPTKIENDNNEFLCFSKSK